MGYSYTERQNELQYKHTAVRLHSSEYTGTDLGFGSIYAMLPCGGKGYGDKWLKSVSSVTHTNSDLVREYSVKVTLKETGFWAKS